MEKISALPVVMAGGSGTRLWPLSRNGFPKQFLVLHGSDSLFQQAMRRVCGLGSDDIEVLNPAVVGGEEHRFLLADQLRELKLPSATLLLEPVGKNTAPAVTLAALFAIQHDQDPVLVVSAADQTVADEAAFTRSLQVAVREAAAGAVVVLGIQPDRPETGFGYIRCDVGASSSAAVQRFIEKPDATTAERYLAEGGYFWNSGMFVLRASIWLMALKSYRPDIYSATELAWQQRQVDASFLRPGKQAFGAVPSESVDYAVMEPLVADAAAMAATPMRMVKLDAGWSDLGAWEAVWAAWPKDDKGNATRGDALLSGCENTTVYSSGRLVAAVGLKDVVVVETSDSVLVVDKHNSQDVKKVVNQLQSSGRTEHLLHRQVHRPWGWYDSVDAGPRFQVKRIMVKPGATLSLQKHHHRAEHWIVVSGTAEVTRGATTQILTENQSTYIPLGEVHRLANPGIVPLEIIEVQSGSYLGEDDIVRLDDTYGRS